MLLLRHASAGERVSPARRDRVRRLDGAGRRDARALTVALDGYAIERLVSSPHTRCIESIGPLARARGLRVEKRDELRPDASLEEIRALLDELPENALVCTHREVIERLFGGGTTCEKGGAWLLDRRMPRAYLPPPSSAAIPAASRVLVS